MPEFFVSNPISVDLRVAAGSVEIHAEPRDTAVVEITPYDGSAASREAAEQTRVDLVDDLLTIVGPESNGWLLRRTPKIRVLAWVPAGSTGWLRVASADLTSSGVWSQLKLNTASGNVTVDHVTGDLTVNSASGEVRIQEVNNQLTVKTASGNIYARQVDGPVDVTTASGDVQLDEAGSGVRVKSVSGDTALRATRKGTVHANSVSGNVSVGVVVGTGAWVDLNTLSGKTRSDLDLSGSEAPTGGPALTVQVRTVSGDIDLHRTASLPG